MEDIDKGPVVVIFTATWCGYCKSTKPRFKAVASKHKDVKAVEIDVDKHGDIADKNRVESMPTMIAFLDGKEKKRVVGGGAAKKEIEALFEAVSG